jgi:O-methyltransferase
MSEINSYEELIDYLIKHKLTMVNKGEFNTILRHYNSLIDIEGDIVECGVWRGGFSIFLSLVFRDKNIWVCDSYEGFQPLEGAKHQYDKERHVPSYTHNADGPLAISLEEVQSHFTNFGLGDDPRIKYLKGFVKDTLPNSGIDDISILRVDVDAYSATLEVLEELYPKVKTGGYVIFDDSCLYESLDAIKVYFKANNIPYFLHHPITDEKLDLNKSYTNDNSGFPAGCYIIKE